MTLTIQWLSIISVYMGSVCKFLHVSLIIVSDYARSLYPMTPPGVHINKTALAIIIGLLVVIILGFKYKRGTDSAFFDKLSDRKTESILQQQSKIRDVQLEELKKEPEKEIKKEPENQEVNKEQKQVELNKEPENQQVNKELEKTQGNKEPEKHKKENMAAVDWKTVDINSVIIPDEIVKSATEKMKVEEKTYKVMVSISRT